MMSRMDLPVMPPVKPMLAKSVSGVPAPGTVEGGLLYEPKWDGFRCLVFRDGAEVELASRDTKSLTRYFPEVVRQVLDQVPPRCVLDGEIVIARDGRLDFDALLQRIHPAESRVALLAAETPASFVAFDLLALGDDAYTQRPLRERRAALEQALDGARPPVFTTPATTDHAVAQRWFDVFEGAGLDGVVAKPLDGPYLPDARAMLKVKHERTADCVVAGFRWHKSGPVVGSLLLGLYDEAGTLHHVGVSASFPMARRAALVDRRAAGRPPPPRGDQPLECGQGPVVGPVAPRARRRGRLRPHAGRPVPAHRAVPPLARRPRGPLVHLPPARTAHALRPRRGARR